MKMSEVLLIKLDTNGFERFYNRKMQECGCTVLPISDFRREKYGLSVLRPLQLRQLTPRYLAQYRLIVLFEEPALFLYLKKRIDRAGQSWCSGTGISPIAHGCAEMLRCAAVAKTGRLMQ